LHFDTFYSFCQSDYSKNSLTELEQDFCKIVNRKLSTVTGERANDLNDPTKSPGLCVKYKNRKNKLYIQYLVCEKLGGAPNCYSGFCDRIAQCVDCPTAVVYKKGLLEPAVCGNAGVCRLGWTNDKTRGGNGYCVCFNGMRGLACNQYIK
jgi:hypothetical protein